ncbi:MAG: hypothetical protein ABH878_04215 [bacterium]
MDSKAEASTQVATAVQGFQTAGANTHFWNAAQFAFGIYLVRLEMSAGTSLQRFVVVK